MEAIHNPKLQARYDAQREQFKREAVSGETHEEWAFHGCPPDAIKPILHEGFRPGHEVGIRNGNAYGKGEYLGRTSNTWPF